MRYYRDKTISPLARRFQLRRRCCCYAGILSSLLLSGYVVPPAKVLERWARSDARGPVRGPVVVPVRWGEQAGQLYVAGGGRSALALEGAPTRFETDPGTAPATAAFWRAVDLFGTDTTEDLALSLDQIGVDLARGGYARSGRSADGVAHTLGARGEGEQDLPQVWFARVPIWPIRVLLPGVGDVSIGPPGSNGWPAWFLVEDGSLLEVVGAPSAASTPPEWAQPLPNVAPSDRQSPADWRRVFEHLLR